MSHLGPSNPPNKETPNQLGSKHPAAFKTHSATAQATQTPTTIGPDNPYDEQPIGDSNQTGVFLNTTGYYLVLVGIALSQPSNANLILSGSNALIQVTDATSGNIFDQQGVWTSSATQAGVDHPNAGMNRRMLVAPGNRIRYIVAGSATGPWVGRVLICYNLFYAVMAL